MTSNTLDFGQDDDDPEVWIDWDYSGSSCHSEVMVHVTTDGRPPNEAFMSDVVRLLNDTDDLVRYTATLILDNYSFEHCKKLGIDESCLVEETNDALAAVAELESISFDSPRLDSFEMSFSLPWDEEHSYDVEFCNGKATNCSVNG